MSEAPNNHPTRGEDERTRMKGKKGKKRKFCLGVQMHPMQKCDGGIFSLIVYACPIASEEKKRRCTGGWATVLGGE